MISKSPLISKRAIHAWLKNTLSDVQKTYTMVSNWSGAVGKKIISIRNDGGTSGIRIVLKSMDVGIYKSGNIDLFDLIRVSGAQGGSAGTIVKKDTLNSGTSVVISGAVDGATIISGNSNGDIIKSLLMEANVSGAMHNYTYEFVRGHEPYLNSGEGVALRHSSGLGIGVAAFNWQEKFTVR